jgi:hypothetical protein
MDYPLICVGPEAIITRTRIDLNARDFISRGMALCRISRACSGD